MWNQRAATSPHAPVLWDYHVVLLAEGPLEVFDLDSCLGVPCTLAQWLKGTFPEDRRVEPSYQPSFRVVDADCFIRTFASDRSHMRTPDGAWQAPPPKWPAIHTASQTMNLMSFVDLQAPFVGRVLSLREMHQLAP
jgi:hypothetical protein